MGVFEPIRSRAVFRPLTGSDPLGRCRAVIEARARPARDIAGLLALDGPAGAGPVAVSRWLAATVDDVVGAARFAGTLRVTEPTSSMGTREWGPVARGPAAAGGARVLGPRAEAAVLGSAPAACTVVALTARFAVYAAGRAGHAARVADIRAGAAPRTPGQALPRHRGDDRRRSARGPQPGPRHENAPIWSPTRCAAHPRAFERRLGRVVLRREDRPGAQRRPACRPNAAGTAGAVQRAGRTGTSGRQLSAAGTAGAVPTAPRSRTATATPRRWPHTAPAPTRIGFAAECIAPPPTRTHPQSALNGPREHRTESEESR